MGKTKGLVISRSHGIGERTEGPGGFEGVSLLGLRGKKNGLRDAEEGKDEVPQADALKRRRE